MDKRSASTKHRSVDALRLSTLQDWTPTRQQHLLLWEPDFWPWKALCGERTGSPKPPSGESGNRTGPHRPASRTPTRQQHPLLWEPDLSGESGAGMVAIAR